MAVKRHWTAGKSPPVLLTIQVLNYLDDSAGEYLENLVKRRQGAPERLFKAVVQ